jgi:hypothetical protein
MRPHANAAAAGELGHFCNVTVKSIEDDDQRWGLDLGDGGSYFGGRRVAHSLTPRASP